MKYFYGFFCLSFAILTVDWALATFDIWRKERKRDREMQKWGLSPFNPKQRNWWEA